MNLKNCFTAKLKISNMKKNVTKELETLFSKVEPVQLAAAIFDLMAKHQALMAHYIKTKSDNQESAVINEIVMPKTESVFLLQRLYSSLTNIE